MTDSSDESTLRQRKGNEEKVTEGAETGKDSSKTEEKKPEAQTTWQIVKYYFNRFRYYHYVIADTIDLYASAACLWIINMYFKLFMGIGPEAPSVLSEES